MKGQFSVQAAVSANLQADQPPRPNSEHIAAVFHRSARAGMKVAAR
jgi:hypothetical protein